MFIFRSSICHFVTVDLSLRNKFGKGIRFLTTHKNTKGVVMQDYIEDLLDDVEDYDDDIADDYSDI